MPSVSYEELLARDGMVVTHVAGGSMEPLLHDRESIVIVESVQRVTPRRNDVVLFRKDGVYILHRVLTASEKEYIICGDNCRESDHVERDEILGVMTGYYRTPEGRKIVRGGLCDRGYCLLLPLIRFAGPRWARLKKTLRRSAR